MANLPHAPAVFHLSGEVQSKEGLLRVGKRLTIDRQSLPLLTPPKRQRGGKIRRESERLRCFSQQLRAGCDLIFFLRDLREISHRLLRVVAGEVDILRRTG
eukprot:TRINITY_DN11721_c0_g2_i1.p3 TRINITY_DN11721_c0_g2~~TRINITY_DN11721_c0_g2_i1.p3  ORF type:complete len:101 (-),score=2.86 TRINITY_DN11721_c0_g2_i1:103-405(-)